MTMMETMACEAEASAVRAKATFTDKRLQKRLRSYEGWHGTQETAGRSTFRAQYIFVFNQI